jgi:hypothetical protein
MTGDAGVGAPVGAALCHPLDRHLESWRSLDASARMFDVGEISATRLTVQIILGQTVQIKPRAPPSRSLHRPTLALEVAIEA